jgi:hypothetical protein
VVDLDAAVGQQLLEVAVGQSVPEVPANREQDYKVVKRIAFGFTSFRNYRIRTLLYAGPPNWDLVATITPTSP